jgi:hypothetical protein
MSRNAQIERSQPIAPQTIRPTLQNDARRPKRRDRRLHDGLEELDVALVVDPVLEGHVEGEVLSEPIADFVDGTGSGEEVARVFVEGDGEDAIGLVEGFLDAVAVVNVDVDVEDSRVMSE